MTISDTTHKQNSVNQNGQAAAFGSMVTSSQFLAIHSPIFTQNLPQPICCFVLGSVLWTGHTVGNKTSSVPKGVYILEGVSRRKGEKNQKSKYTAGDDKWSEDKEAGKGRGRSTEDQENPDPMKEMEWR